VQVANERDSQRAILYARVSTDEQARSGYSLAQQLQALREHAAMEGYSIAEEVVDPGQSGASLERPGLDRVRELVAAGGIDVVIAQDIDRISREPWHHEFLRSLLEDHGTDLRSLDDDGDDSPLGEFVRHIRRGVAKLEKADIVKRSQRGKLQKAREGKVIATRKTKYGFKLNEASDGYRVAEANMTVVRRIFRMIASEGASIHRVKKTLEQALVPTPDGGRYWSKKTIREMVLNDVYKPHTFSEMQSLGAEGLLSPNVAGKLDPEKRYGVWWFNKQRYSRTRVSEPDGDGGRRYGWRQKIVPKPRAEWVAVPVPDSGVPREWVERARDAIENNEPRSCASEYRYWELAGVFFCGVCGCRMSKTRRGKGRGYAGYYHYYFCPTRTNKGYDACSQHRGFRAEQVEAQVWEEIRALLVNPERLRRGLDAMVEEKRRALCGDPTQQIATVSAKLDELEDKRMRFQHAYAEGAISLEDLRARLAELENDREGLLSILGNIKGQAQELEDLERDRDVLLEGYAGVMPDRLDAMAPEERHGIYKMLKLRVVASADRTLTASGIILTEGDPFPHEGGPFPSDLELARGLRRCAGTPSPGPPASTTGRRGPSRAPRRPHAA
jgi:site-specific DNA recombinase